MDVDSGWVKGHSCWKDQKILSKNKFSPAGDNTGLLDEAAVACLCCCLYILRNKKILKLALLTLTAQRQTKYFTQWNNFEKFSCNTCQGWDQHLSQEEIGWSSDRSNKEVIISCFLLAQQYFLPQIALSSRWLKQSVSDLLSSSFGS